MNFIKLDNLYVNLDQVRHVRNDGPFIVIETDTDALRIDDPKAIAQLRRVLDDASKPNEPRPESMHKPPQRSIAGMDEARRHEPMGGGS